MPTVAAPPADPRVAAVCAPDGPEVFSAIVHGNQIWTPDPLDVEAIHADAREAFTRLLDRAAAPDPPPHGKSLLLLGESGSGKTHLMRAFRTAAHADGQGYCGYLQMTSRSDNYARYLLANLIDSLEHPYRPAESETGLHRLARGLLDALDVIPAADRARLCDDLLEPDELARLVHRFADVAVQYPRFRAIDVNVLRAVLYTLPNDGRVRPRVLNWLRCEDLSKYDRELIGDLVPRPQPEMPLKTVLDLGRLMHAVHGAALVLLVDQIEEVLDQDRPGEQKGEVLRRMVNAVVDVTDGLPSAVVVLACLEELFVVGKPLLPKPKLDRLERDPEAVKLVSRRTADEVRAMVARRLEVAFEAAGTAPDGANPIAPYSDADLAPLANMRTRDVIDFFRGHQDRCRLAGEWVPVAAPAKVAPVAPPPVELERDWNDFVKGYKPTVLDSESGLADLLADTVRAASAEVPAGVHFGADPDERFVQVEVHTPGNAVDKLLVAVCDKSTRGGGLSRQVEEVVKRVGELPAVLVRSTDFPTDSKQKTVKDIAGLVAPKGKGRKVVVSNSDWRAMAAFREFAARNAAAPGFAAWQRAEQPLSKLAAVARILPLDALRVAPPPAEPPAVPPPPVGVAKPVPPPPLTPPTPVAGAIRLGATRGAAPTPVELVPKSLCRHAGFLGGSGSGKTTAALTVIEQLLVAGVPVVMLDRKGDLAKYADPAAWDEPEPDADRAARRRHLRERIEVSLYTPGADAGRPLAVPVVPADLGSLTAADREPIAQHAAATLGLMMGFKTRTTDPRQVILQKGIELLARDPGRPVTLAALGQLAADMDEALTEPFAGRYEAKLFTSLAERLLTLELQRKRLFEGGEPLDIDALFGRSTAGKTRLSVVYTEGLGDAGTIDFWVSQFLLAVDRWRAKHPAPAGVLQAVLLIDEADRYLPAVGLPASKRPLEGLLRRARSAGIGLFLGTQTPGDLDYKCRDQILTWLLGRIGQPTALQKVKVLLDAKPGAIDKLAEQVAGEFYLVREEGVGAIRADRNLIPTDQLPEDRILALARAGR